MEMKDPQSCLSVHPTLATPLAFERTRVSKTSHGRLLQDGAKKTFSVRFADRQKKDEEILFATAKENNETLAKSEKFRWPITSYYHTSTFPSLYATFCAGGMRSKATAALPTTSFHPAFNRSSALKVVHSRELNSHSQEKNPSKIKVNDHNTEANQNARFPWRHCGRALTNHEDSLNNNLTNLTKVKANGQEEKLNDAAKSGKENFDTGAEAKSEKKSTSHEDPNKATKKANLISCTKRRLSVNSAAPTRGCPVRSLSLSNLNQNDSSSHNVKSVITKGVIMSVVPINTWKYDSKTVMPIWHGKKGDYSRKKETPSRPTTTKTRPHSVYSFSSNAKTGTRKTSSLRKHTKSESKLAFMSYYSAQWVDADPTGTKESRTRKGSKFSSKLRKNRSFCMNANNNTATVQSCTNLSNGSSNQNKSNAPVTSPETTELTIVSDDSPKTRNVSTDITSVQTKNISSLDSNQQVTKTLLNEKNRLSVSTVTSLARHNEESQFHKDAVIKSQSPYKGTRGRLSAPAFLSSDQLVIRESVEKVQRWMKGLPKHFDPIHHVLPPVQQDY
ncbi:unnamed protein product [Clavelina lepadiformis]|uniref:Uncharacterized protein n=1 Tax=Clavelina lepadiformis TaxID=159417 RepID=A0ABP0F4W3_CLALP